jgi:hypothetical protein
MADTPFQDMAGARDKDVAGARDEADGSAAGVREAAYSRSRRYSLRP